MKIHIAGFAVKVGPQGRQLCAWCGELLFTADARREMVSPNADGTPGDPPAPWETGALVGIDGGTSMLVPHQDGAQLPDACCAPGLPPPGCPNCCEACLSATGGQCREHTEPESDGCYDA